MNTGKNRVKGLKTELFKKKYQTNPVVENPTESLQGRGLVNMLASEAKASERQRQLDNQARRFPVTVPRQYTEKEIGRMRNNFPMSAEDFQTSNAYGIAGLPDLMAGQDINDIRSQNQILQENELLTSSPQSLRNFQNDGFNQEVQAASDKALSSSEDRKFQIPNFDWREATRMGVGVTSATKGLYDDSQTRSGINERIQKLNDRGRYMPNEYEFMGKPGSQSVIYAKNGAEIRRGTQSGAEEAELERGEMFMLPNLDTYVVGGKKHSQGGEDFVLPEGTIVFSDHLKVPGIGKTFGEQAKKFDITKYKDILDNPHSKSVDRTTAEIMMDRNSKKLQELFEIQQGMNGNSNGELRGKTTKYAQQGMGPTTNLGNPNRTAPLGFTPEQEQQFYNQQNQFDAPTTAETQAKLTLAELRAKGLATYTQFQADEQSAVTAEMTKRAAKANPLQGGVLGAEETLTPGTASELVGANEADETTAGSVSKTNASDKTSMYYRTAPNGRKVYVEDQGEMKGKSRREQYANNPFLLLSNRLDEHYEKLSPLLLSAYQMQLKNKNLKVNNAEELVDLLEAGNNTLYTFRNFYKNIGQEEKLFDPTLDSGKDGNQNQQRTALMMKEYIESPQYLADVQSGDATTYFPWLKNQPKEIRDKAGNLTGYSIESAEINKEFTEKYQAAYKALAGVKSQQVKGGKDKDMLRGVQVTPEGLNDQTFLGLPISPVEGIAGNTLIGQLLGFEGEDSLPKISSEKKESTLKTSAGNSYNEQVKPAVGGKYERTDFDYTQLAPELYGAAASQMFGYAPMDYNAPYVMPQTLNIQPQLQDVDSSYMAAINSGADPNAALIATLGAKQKLYSEKQNFDAQQRAQADQVNAQSRFQEDIYDMQSLDKVYNTLVARADDAVTAQRQAIVTSASKKRAMYNMEENKKKLYIENFVRNYKVDGKTGSITVDVPEGYDPIQLGNFSSTFENYLAEQEQIQKAAAAKKSNTK